MVVVRVWAAVERVATTRAMVVVERVVVGIGGGVEGKGGVAATRAGAVTGLGGGARVEVVNKVDLMSAT